ncbi:ECF-type sigma factor [Haloferula chungangensis]|uniref:ECF-type sigma factor n=1 Tax=Haloferula chungangensis TaxID=1048331 RepID=A0ABW2L7E0_9BACT
MDDVTRILDAVERGETQAAEELLPLAYEELRRMAASKMAAERGSHTLQATALVHEAYVKMLGPEGEGRSWRGKQHFFAAAAEAMRRILIDRARKKQTNKRGGDPVRTTWNEAKFASELPSDEILAVDDALAKMEQQNADLAKLVKLRYFAGLSIAETATALGVSESSVDRSWRGARVWLFREISNSRNREP